MAAGLTRRTLLAVAAAPTVDPLARIEKPWNAFAKGVEKGTLDLKALESVVREGAKLLGLTICK